MTPPETVSNVPGPDVTPASPAPGGGKTPSRGRADMAGRLTEWGIIVALIIMVVVSIAAVHGFTEEHNIQTILWNAAFLGAVAIGMTFVVISANYIDLSVVAQIAVAGVIVTTMEPHSLILGMILATLACLVFAAVNGFAVGVMKVNGVVVTLAVEYMGLGLLEYITNSAQYNGTSNWMKSFGSDTGGPIPDVFFVFVVAALIAQFVLTRTTIGFSLRSVGSNREAAKLAGVRPGRAVMFAFVMCSLGCALAGILLAAFNNNALPTLGSGYDFDSLAAVIIGGTTFLGGRGSVVRTVIGVLFLEVLLNILVLIGLSYEMQQLIEGLVIVVAVAVDALMRRRGVLS